MPISIPWGWEFSDVPASWVLDSAFPPQKLRPDPQLGNQNPASHMAQQKKGEEKEKEKRKIMAGKKTNENKWTNKTQDK